MRTVPLTLVLTLSALAGCSSAAPAQCQARTTDHANVSVQVADDRTLNCASISADGDMFGAPPTVFRGKIVSAEADTVVLDLCEVSQPCIPNGLRIVVDAPGSICGRCPTSWAKSAASAGQLPGLSPGARVHDCRPLRWLPLVEAPGQLLLAVSDGREPITGAPYEMKRVRLGCSSEQGCGAVAPDEYFFEVSASVSAPPSVVYMGQTLDWQGVGRRFAVRNLRSFQSTACDDYWNFAYYIAPK